MKVTASRDALHSKTTDILVSALQPETDSSLEHAMLNGTHTYCAVPSYKSKTIGVSIEILGNLLHAYLQCSNMSTCHSHVKICMSIGPPTTSGLELLHD